ncbi:MAG: guanylate kinase [Nitrospinae bacterium]|nr:guanylate kinase [Nitrospinota bacterium]
MTTGYRENKRGILFTLSAPSGAGKTTAANLLLEKAEGLRRSISHTTRAKRVGETDGVDYHFVGRERFEEMVRHGDFIEWAEVHGNLYGTSFANVEETVSRLHSDLLLVIDVQGARALRERGVNCRLIFLLPPSMEELRRRIETRGTDTAESLATRLENAKAEMAAMEEFDYVVVNDNIDQAVAQLMAIITAERLKTENRGLRPNKSVLSKGDSK